jgi:hypothetical protein
LKHAQERPVYWILNLCRVLAYTRDGEILSKEGGGLRGVREVPAELRPVVEEALAAYRRVPRDEGTYDPVALHRFTGWIRASL